MITYRILRDIDRLRHDPDTNLAELPDVSESKPRRQSLPHAVTNVLVRLPRSHFHDSLAPSALPGDNYCV